MGGYALGDVVRRFDTLEFVALRNEVLSKLRDAIPSVRLEPIASYYEKPSHGDLDLLICTDNLPPDWRDRACGVLTCRARVDNGPVLSVEHKGLQVDLIAECGDVFAFAFRYYSWNDMGNLIGRVAHQAGFKFGHNGLWYVLREGTRKYADIRLTLDFDEALMFFGYNPNRYRQGFNALEDIFHYVTSTPYFVPHAFSLEGRSHRARVRDAKRPTYQMFLHWIQVHPTITRVMRSREQWLQAAIDRFQHMGARIAEARFCHARSVAVRTRFNGNLVRQWTGLEGRDLGAFMRSFIEQRSEDPSKSVEELVEGRTESEVRRLVLDYYRKLERA
jgi:hypothetical protein